MNEKLDIKFREVVPKYYQIEEHIRGLVSSGAVRPGHKLPSEENLARRWNLNRLTINKAIGNLVKEGLLSRQRGQGTYISDLKPRLSARNIVAIAMQTHGHLYAPLSGRIISSLEKQKYYCVSVNVSEKNSYYDKLECLLEQKPEFLVADGSSYFPFKLLKSYGGRTIVVFRDEGPEEPGWTYAVSDYYRGGRAVAEYLLSLGFAGFVHVTEKIRESQKSNLLRIKGIKDVFKERGIAPDNFRLCEYSGRTEMNSSIKTLLSRGQKPMALFCSLDITGKTVYKNARDLGLEIPGDVSVLGYYNTPWCEAFHPELSSVSIEEEKIADTVAGIIVRGDSEGEKILVEPRIIPRGSTRKI